MKKKICRFLNKVIRKIQREAYPIFPNISKTARIADNVRVISPQYLYMEDNTNIDAGAVIMNGANGKFIMKKNSGAAIGLTAVCGNHMSIVGLSFKQVNDDVKRALDINKEYSGDIIVNEDVWIGANVTLLQGSCLGRGSEIGAGSVVRGKVPPYSVVIGNPCKIVGFRFTPEEIIEHEKQQYEEFERLSLGLVEKNYEKYYLNRINDIKHYLKIF